MPKKVAAKASSVEASDGGEDGHGDHSNIHDSYDAFGELAGAFLRLEGRDEVEHFLRDLCTPEEIRALGERWHVARLLDAGGHTYRDIRDKTGVSTTTVGRVARFLLQEPHQGYRVVLDRVEVLNAGAWSNTFGDSEEGQAN